MKTHTLFDEFLFPENKPTFQSTTENSVYAWSDAQEYPIVFEVFEKDTNIYGFRYQAWIAWRDAGNVVRDHDWRMFEPQILFTDNPSEAIAAADMYAKVHGVELTEVWKTRT